MDLLVGQESRAEPDDSWNKGGIGAAACRPWYWGGRYNRNSFLPIGSRMHVALLLMITVAVSGRP